MTEGDHAPTQPGSLKVGELTLSEIVDGWRGSVMWGRIGPGGAFHAFDQSWWDECTWVPRCSRRHGARTDLQLVSLDLEPGDPVCRQPGCQRALAAWLRLRARYDERAEQYDRTSDAS